MKNLKTLDGGEYIDVGSVSFFINLERDEHADPALERLLEQAVDASFQKSLAESGLANQFRVSYTESREGCLIVTIGIVVASTFAADLLRNSQWYRDRLGAAAKRLNGDRIGGEKNPRRVWLYRTDIDQTPVQIFINNLNIVEKGNMGDTYNVGQAVAVGPHASGIASQVSFQQVWAQNQGTIDLQGLAKELATLRGALRQRATEPEQDIAVGQVAAAEAAAKKGDGPKMLEHLKSAGMWVLDVAKDIGVEIAAAVIRKSAGLPE